MSVAIARLMGVKDKQGAAFGSLSLAIIREGKNRESLADGIIHLIISVKPQAASDGHSQGALSHLSMM